MKDGLVPGLKIVAFFDPPTKVRRACSSDYSRERFGRKLRVS